MTVVSIVVFILLVTLLVHGLHCYFNPIQN